MKLSINRYCPLSAIAFVLILVFFQITNSWACTTVVISGRATADGRPILWKNRDTTGSVHNEVAYFSEEGNLKFIGVVAAGSRKSVWMGVNEAGFCIENSLSRDLAVKGAKGPGNGGFMKLALETCSTVKDFRKLLEETDRTGRSTCANFGVIDAQGGAAIFESSARSHRMFDANDPKVAPNHYIVRTNFSIEGQEISDLPTDEELSDVFSKERYLRTCSLMESRIANDISVPFIIRNCTRDLADEEGCPIPGTVNAAESSLPEAIITDLTINRDITVSAAVFHGVHPGEDPALTTMWAMLGAPAFSIAVPCWVGTGEIADPLSGDRGGELGELSVSMRGWMTNIFVEHEISTEGLDLFWKAVWLVEDQILNETLKQKDRWAQQKFTPEQLTSFHENAAEKAMESMLTQFMGMKTDALNQPAPPAPKFSQPTPTLSP
ncbi:carcinine hydrolase/isopenicillin-N N-acyltransferase family protein [uncultured Rubinisphaera sp.]|uniref:carcinine hydrolase/isopenicillin-N N-acyltransferase family protein n=1 Tax=uncultured Rubinisphaera sp. TaxID=1678686 RepID=UPI0030DD4A86